MRDFKKLLLLALAFFLFIIVFSYWQVTPEKKPLPLDFLPPVSEEQLFSFAVFSDIHSDLENLQKALVVAKNNQADFLIITGDLTTVGSFKELSEVKNVLEVNSLMYYVIPGNHDFWASGKIWGDLFREVFGPDFQSFRRDNVKFILLNNAHWQKGIGKVTNEKGINQKGWLSEEVEECSRLYCLVFLHMPLNHPAANHIMGEDNIQVASEAAELVNLFVISGVKEVFAGHLHYALSYELGGLKTTIIGALTGERNIQLPRFLEITVKKTSPAGFLTLDRREVFLADE